jgi:hypothetical protein
MTDKLLLISADAHAGALPEDHRDHFDPDYRHRVDELVAESEAFVKRSGYLQSKEAVDMARLAELFRNDVKELSIA